jgi:hypothetical protein
VLNGGQRTKYMFAGAVRLDLQNNLCAGGSIVDGSVIIFAREKSANVETRLEGGGAGVVGSWLKQQRICYTKNTTGGPLTV